MRRMITLKISFAKLSEIGGEVNLWLNEFRLAEDYLNKHKEDLKLGFLVTNWFEENLREGSNLISVGRSNSGTTYLTQTFRHTSRSY